MPIVHPPEGQATPPTPYYPDGSPCRDCGCDFCDHNHPVIGGCGSCGDCGGWC